MELSESEYEIYIYIFNRFKDIKGTLKLKLISDYPAFQSKCQ